PEVRGRAAPRIAVENAEPEPERLGIVRAAAVDRRAAARTERAQLPGRRLVLADALASGEPLQIAGAHGRIRGERGSVGAPARLAVAVGHRPGLGPRSARRRTCSAR